MKKYTISQHFDGNITIEIIASNEDEAIEKFEKYVSDLQDKDAVEFLNHLDLQDDSPEIDYCEPVEWGGEYEDDCYGDYLYDQWKDEVLMEGRR